MPKICKTDTRVYLMLQRYAPNGCTSQPLNFIAGREYVPLRTLYRSVQRLKMARLILTRGRRLVGVSILKQEHSQINAIAPELGNLIHEKVAVIKKSALQKVAVIPELGNLIHEKVAVIDEKVGVIDSEKGGCEKSGSYIRAHLMAFSEEIKKAELTGKVDRTTVCPTGTQFDLKILNKELKELLKGLSQGDIRERERESQKVTKREATAGNTEGAFFSSRYFSEIGYLLYRICGGTMGWKDDIKRMSGTAVERIEEARAQKVSRPKQPRQDRPSDVTRLFIDRFTTGFPAHVFAELTARDHKHMKDLCELHGIDTMKKAVDYLFDNWPSLQRHYRISSLVPSIRILFGFRAQIIPDAVEQRVHRSNVYGSEWKGDMPKAPKVAKDGIGWV